MSKPVPLSVFKPVFANDLWGGSPRMSFVVGAQGVQTIRLEASGVVVIESNVQGRLPLYMFPGGASALGEPPAVADGKK